MSYSPLPAGSEDGDAVRQCIASPQRSTNASPHRVPLEGRESWRISRLPKKWWNRSRQLFLDKKERYSWLDWLGEFVPCLDWLRTYDFRTWLLADMVAGISVACMEIPQGMSYASLAGLPYIFGLNGATIPCIVYCIFGSSRQLAVGPVAVSSMLLGGGLSEMFGGRVNENPNTPDNPRLQQQYNEAAVQVAFLVGLIYAVVGLLRLGWLTNFLSHSVISGFMSGASIVIALSQVKYLLGVQLPRADTLPGLLHDIIEHLNEASVYELTMGLSFILLLVGFKLLANRHKRLMFLKALGPITVSFLSILIMSIFRLYERPSPQEPYIREVGSIPPGLPQLTAGWWFPLRAPSAQLTLAVLIVLVDGVEAMSIAKSLAAANGYELDATQDLRALGLSNLAGSAFSCYNTTGSFSRSAVNNDVGAKTPLASGISGVLLMLTLLHLTPLFTHMSKNVQGAYIITGVLPLFDWRECLFLYQVNKPDWLVWVVALLSTMCLGVQMGIGVSVGLALVQVIYRSAFPRIATLGRLPDTNPGLYRNRKMYPTTLDEPGMLLLRIDAPIYFANVQPVKEGIRKAVRKARQQQEIQFVILDFSPVTDIDAEAVHFLDSFLDELRAGGLQLALANPSQQVVTLLRRSKLLTKIGEQNIHVNMHDGVECSRVALERQECMLSCP